MKNLAGLFFQILFTSFFLFPINTNAQWESINGLEGCEGARLGQNATHVYAGTTNGLYRSSDDGNSWDFVAIDGSDNYQITDLIVRNDTVIIRGYSNDFTGIVFSLFASYDDGVTWNQLNHPGEPGYFFPDIAFQEETIYFGRNNYPEGPLILYSNDGGYTWQNSELQDSLENFSYLFEFENGFIAKGVNLAPSPSGFQNRFFYAEAGTDQWSEFSFSNIDSLTNFYVRESSLFAQQNYDTLFCSTDQGQTWAASDLPISYLEDGSLVRKGSDLFCFFLENEVLKSSDEGLTWTETNFNFDPDNYFGPRSIIVRGDEFIASNYPLGIGRGTTNFSPSNTGINALSVWNMNILNGDELYASDQKYTISQDLWEIDDKELSIGMVIQHNGQLIRLDGNVSISDDEGNTWTDITPDYLYEPPFTKILIHEDRWYVFGSYNLNFSSDNTSVKYSDDSGQTWNNHDHNPYQIVQHEGMLFITSQTGVYQSIDDGQTWELIINGLDLSAPSPTGGPYFAYEIFPVVDRLFLMLKNYGDEQKFFVSDDNGTTWVLYNAFPPELDLLKRDFSLVDIDGVLVIFSNNLNAGMFISIDNGNSWVSFNEGLHQWVINSLAVGSEYIYIGTAGQGIFRRSLADLNFRPVSGYVYKDDNNNGIWDNNEPPFPDVLVSGVGNTLQYAASKQDGSYQLFANFENPITLQIHPPLNPSFYEINPTSITVSQQDSMINFGVYINPDLTDLEIDHVVTTAIRPGFNASFYIFGKNKSAINQSGKIRWVVQDDFDFVSANPVPDQIVDDTLVWQFVDLASLDDYPISLTLLGSTNLMLGEEIQNVSFITTPTNDIDIYNNSDTTYTIVVGSYDPNDKQVEPATNLSPQQIQEGTPLDYTIRFQNTGTYLAETVKIVDYLDPKLNKTSLHIIGTSHPYTYNLTTEGRLEFIFDMINLPDSTANEMDSHGFIKYSILPNSDIPLGEKITNFASIYFDFNDPIITNEVETEIALPVTQTFELNQIQDAIIYPNPTNGFCKLLFKEEIAQPLKVEVYDVNGRLVKQVETFSNVKIELDMSQQNEGIYLIKGVSTSHFFSGKVILIKE